MLPLPTIQLHSTSHTLRELTFHAAIKTSRVPFEHNERRITVFLQHVLADQDLPLQMTAQERYYALLHYLNNQQGAMLETGIDCKKYLLDAPMQSLLDDQIEPQKPFVSTAENGDYSIRLMTGREAELLEQSCTDIADWIIGSLAIELAAPELPPTCALESDSDVLSESLINRATLLKNMPQAQLNALYAMHSHLRDETVSLCRLSLDDTGIILLGGADDAPVRFRPSAAFIGIAAELDRRATAKSAPDR
jgi:hypothetical protein